MRDLTCVDLDPGCDFPPGCRSGHKPCRRARPAGTVSTGRGACFRELVFTPEPWLTVLIAVTGKAFSRMLVQYWNSRWPDH